MYEHLLRHQGKMRCRNVVGYRIFWRASVFNANSRRRGLSLNASKVVTDKDISAAAFSKSYLMLILELF